MTGYADLIAKRARLLAEAAQLYDLEALNWKLAAGNREDEADHWRECVKRLREVNNG